MQTNQWMWRLGAFGVACLVLVGSLMGRATGAAAMAGRATSGATILNPAGGPFVITGITWYGFETTGYVAHGLYAHDYTYIVDEIKQYGYNTIRIPFSNQMWKTDPIPNPNTISACPLCKGSHSRDILARIINYAGSIGLHVILDNHRSEAGNSAEANGLWYATSRGNSYTESAWINDWVSVQRWVHGIGQTQAASDTVSVTATASVLGYDLRNEPHTPSRAAYLSGATWGTGDGINPASNPNPNPFDPSLSCVAASTCHDWRLAAERAGDTLLGDASAHGWAYPLIFVEGISQYPTATGTAANGPYDYYWWGGQLQGVNGNASNPGAPIVLNASVLNSSGKVTSLGPAVANQLVYSAHDFGPSEFAQGWFNSSTCYASDCSSSSLADVWYNHWAYIDTTSGVNPVWPGHSSYPWGNTSATSYAQAPLWIGEFGTGNTSAALNTSGAGSQGQWFTDLVNFIQSSYTHSNNSGITLTSPLNWTYWALNTEDSYALLGSGYTGLANATKEYSFLCVVQQTPAAQCGSTGPLPTPK